jgi:hypothetical protein
MARSRPTLLQLSAEGPDMRQTAIACLLLLVTVPVFGEQATPEPQSTAPLGALRRTTPTDPYRKLFSAQQALKSALVEAQKAQPKATIVCGMLIIPADPSIDPKIAVPLQKAPGVEFKIRAFEPPVCNPAK